MKRRVHSLAYTLLLCAALYTVLGSSAHAQQAFPLNFELPGTKGPIQLQQLSGKVVYVDFWASWCAPCQQSFPFMNELLRKYSDKGLRIVAINVDKERKDVDVFLNKNPAQFMIAFDPEGKTPLQYQVKGMPTSYLIGRDGKLIHIHRGFRNADREQIERSIQEALQ